MGTPLTPLVDISPDLARDGGARELAKRLRGLQSDGAEMGGGQKGMTRTELREAAQGFEAMLLNELLKEMFPDEESEGALFGKGPGSGAYQQMFLSELSSTIAKDGQLGLAEIIERDVAARAGLTEESTIWTEPIPGRTLGRPLPQPLRRSSYVRRSYGESAQRESELSFGGRLSFIKPLDGGWESSRFGVRTDPFTGEKRRHHGIDIAAPEGSAVRAAAPGKVSFSGRMPGYGKVVIIEHAGGYETRYAHNSDNIVRKGDTVEAGQEVATVGSTGRSTGPHLHFEVRKDGALVNPDKVLNIAD